MSFARLVLPLVYCLLFASPGYALTIDAFDDDGFVSSTATVGAIASVRTDLGNLIRECRKTNVCKKQ